MINNLDKTILISIYTHPEFYPPTINLAEALVEKGYSVNILCSNNAKEVSSYSKEVNFIIIGKFIPLRSVGKQSTYSKVKHWINYTWNMWKLSKNIEAIVLCDPIPLLSFRVITFFTKKLPIIWYHNHDIMDITQQRKYSISWWAYKNEPQMFSRLDIFSLPAEERKSYFPVKNLKGSYYFLPNFPSLRRYGVLKHQPKNKEEWRIIFQGSVGPGHGIEEICKLLPTQYEGLPIKLILKGFVSKEYKNRINTILQTRNAVDSVEWLGITSYESLAPLTASCHVGIAVFTGKDVMNRTLGTASNKIYEYAASGVPILYFEDFHFNQHLDKYSWAIKTDLTEISLKTSIEYMLKNNETLSKLAKADFYNNLNYEKHFNKLKITN